MKYVSPEYQQRLEDLAETLMASKREQLAQAGGQLALAEVIELRPEVVPAIA